MSSPEEAGLRIADARVARALRFMEANLHVHLTVLLPNRDRIQPGADAPENASA
jgi:hypothetical protein